MESVEALLLEEKNLSIAVMPPNNASNAQCYCLYCSKALQSQNTVRLHVSSTARCNEAWKKQFSQKNAETSHRLPFKYSDEDLPSSQDDDEMEMMADNFHLPRLIVPPSKSFGEVPPSPSSLNNDLDVEGVHGSRFSLPYPHSIANPLSFQKTRFERQRDQDIMNGKQPWQPFSCQDEWDLAKWLINNTEMDALSLT